MSASRHEYANDDNEGLRKVRSQRKTHTHTHTHREREKERGIQI